MNKHKHTNTHTPAAWPVALGIEHRANSTFPDSVEEGKTEGMFLKDI